eukprot:SAG31_NODE_1670_length_7567_cov_13.084360_7_plen_84_part_00
MEQLLRQGTERAEVVTAATIEPISGLRGGTAAGTPGNLQLRVANLGRVDVRIFCHISACLDSFNERASGFSSDAPRRLSVRKY